MEIELPSRVLTLEPAKNVVVGQYSIQVCYPEIEFLFSKPNMRLLSTRFLDNDKTALQVVPALISQVSDMVYRAEISAAVWVEVDAATGITVVHQHGVSTVFTPSTCH